MWMKSEDVPKEDADQILARWDQTAPDVQRMIVLQNMLDNTRLTTEVGDMLAILHSIDEFFQHNNPVFPCTMFSETVTLKEAVHAVIAKATGTK